MWKNYVINSGFKKVLMIAHSAGGGCASAIQRKFADTFYDQVQEIAFTDSWIIGRIELTPDQQKFMGERSVHYQASHEPLGTSEAAFGGSAICPHVSAGHQKHEYTTGCAWPMIM